MDNNFKISENLKIDYNRWNQMATSYIDTYGLTAEAKLNVSLYVDVIGSHAEFDKKISDEATSKLIIYGENFQKFKIKVCVKNKRRKIIESLSFLFLK